ncbi:MAG: flagellin [Synergistaceae bacterium]|nr:flagellin [Synergistaceae bacterium]
MVISKNIAALSTYDNMAAINENLSKAIKKTATGLRINSAGDDAAGLAVSEKMRSQIGGLDQAVDNAQDGISLLQTADGGLAETQGILQRMRELSVQAANGALTWQDRSYIQIEVDQLKEEIDRVSNVTQFNKRKLLNGTASGVWSSDRDTTRAIIRGSLTDVDQFGQKNSFEGNYKIDILAVPGEGMVMKSKIFTYITPEDTYGFVGSGLYYDDDGNRLTADGAAQALDSFYSLGLVNKDTQAITRFSLDATSRTFSSMQEVADALTAQAKAKGSKYEFYFDEDAQALAVMGADHDFRVSASQTTINKLFGVTDIPPSHTSGTRPLDSIHYYDEYDISVDDVRIDADGTYVIRGNGALSPNSITVEAGKKVTIVLENVNIATGNRTDPNAVSPYGPSNPYGMAAFNIEDGAEVELILDGTSTLLSGYGRSGIELGKDSVLQIYDSGNGTLNTTGGTEGAGIGSRGSINGGGDV